MRSYCLGGTLFDPLNIMCSKKCEIPVMPGDSLREPTRYHCQKETAGTLWSSCVRMTSPFGSTWRSTLKRSAVRIGAPAAGAAGAGLGRRFAAAGAGAASTASATASRVRLTAAAGIRARPAEPRGRVTGVRALERMKPPEEKGTRWAMGVRQDSRAPRRHQGAASSWSAANLPRPKLAGRRPETLRTERARVAFASVDDHPAHPPSVSSEAQLQDVD